MDKLHGNDDLWIRQRYAMGESVAEIARHYRMKWRDVAMICGHVWDRPPSVDEDGNPVEGWEETVQSGARVIGID